MKLIAQALVVAALAFGLAACEAEKKPEPASQPTAHSTSMSTGVVNKAKECSKLQRKLRNLDRHAPDTQSKLDAIEHQMQELDCGAK
jgi:TolA-binding protein